jgi:NTE family protein
LLRNPFENLARFRSVYDLRPLRDRLLSLTDFDRLNSGDIRVCICATDVRNGDAVMFDSAKGERIAVEHILASCGFVPEFTPVEINGRQSGDAGLSLNVPFDLLLDDDAGDEPIFVVDLFNRDGEHPQSFAQALERKNDLIFANQTFMRLKARLKDPRLNSSKVTLLSYRGDGPAEPASEKPYDYSRDAVNRRWNAGILDVIEATKALNRAEAAAGLRVVRR